MEPFDYAKAMADMWALGGRSFRAAQEQAFRAMRDGAAALGAPTLPAAPNLASDAGEVAKANQSLSELWMAAANLAATLAQGLPKGTDAESTAAATFRHMVDPRIWLSGGDDMDAAMQRMAEGPQLADLWDTERKYAKVFQAWMTLRRRSLEHQAVVLEGWMTAARRFTERFGELSAKGEAPNSQRAALNLWIETANRALLEMQRSERHLGSQAKLLKASTELRYAQKEVAEYYGQMFGFPTRTELDDVHHSVTELRRELRAIQRQLRATAGTVTAIGRPAAAAVQAHPAGRKAQARS